MLYSYQTTILRPSKNPILPLPPLSPSPPLAVRRRRFRFNPPPLFWFHHRPRRLGYPSHQARQRSPFPPDPRLRPRPPSPSPPQLHPRPPWRLQQGLHRRMGEGRGQERPPLKSTTCNTRRRTRTDTGVQTARARQRAHDGHLVGQRRTEIPPARNDKLSVLPAEGVRGRQRR